jgi:hypothetical protein
MKKTEEDIGDTGDESYGCDAGLGILPLFSLPALMLIKRKRK